MNKKFSIKAFYPNFYSDDLISYVSLRITKYFNDENTVADVMGITSDNSVDRFRKMPIVLDNEGTSIDRRRIYRDALPLLLWRILNKVLSQNKIKSLAERRFLQKIKRDDIVYLWPGASLKLYRKIKTKGCAIVTEMINTMQSTSKAILDKEFASLNLPITHGISEDAARHDTEACQLSDYIFSPSPGVKQSLLDAGIGEDKIISSSYGLKSQEILNCDRNTAHSDMPTLLFVGQICVRKGIHLLLDAWVNARVKAKLQIVGRISPEIRALFNDNLQKYPNIEHVGYVKHLKPLYREADIFILPSLEEGSPLVTYLALGAALPVIASPMGAGGVIANGKEGLLIDPHNRAELVQAIQTLCGDHDLRKQMAAASGKKAFEYTWDKVARRRKAALFERLAARR